MHRALQAAQAAADLIAAETDVAGAVYYGRELSLSEEDQELPAYVVLDGTDSAMSELGVINQTYLDSLLELRVIAYCKARDEEDLRTELARMRSVIHRALMGNQDLGLGFVIGIRYGGAQRPSITNDMRPLGASQEFTFYAHYRMGVATPE